jgi:hypothetical protein
VGDDGDIANLWHEILAFSYFHFDCHFGAAMETRMAAIATLQPPRAKPRGITSASEGLRIAQEGLCRHRRRI